MWRFGLGLVYLIVLIDGAAIHQDARGTEEQEENREKRATKEKRSYNIDDFEYNVATNCREWPRFGVSDPGGCSRISQTETLRYNPLVGETWNMVGGQHGGCPENWIAYQGSCYKTMTEVPATTWELATEECHTFANPLGTRADLVIINSEAENEFVLTQVQNTATAGLVSFWIGAKYINSQWTWNSNNGILGGPQNSYTNWGTTEPATPTEDAFAIIMETVTSGTWESVDKTGPLHFVCEVKQSLNLPGYCRWDAYRSNTDVRSACMCPTTMELCNRRPNCFWYEDPTSPFKECISNSERFYNMLHRLLVRRGKKDFAIKIRYGATPARGHLPLGPYGPAIIGQGNSNPSKTFGVYGLKNQYDTQNGLGMFQSGGLYGPQRHSAVNPYGQPLPGQTTFNQYPQAHGYGYSGQRKQTYYQPNAQYNYAYQHQ